MNQFWQIAVGVAGLGAIGSFVLWSLYRGWLSLEIFAALSQRQTYNLMIVFLVLTFLALIAILVTYIVSQHPSEPSHRSSGSAQGTLMRATHDSNVYLVENGRRHLVPDACTLVDGWSWDDVKVVAPEIIERITLADRLPTADTCLTLEKIQEGMLIKSSDGPEIYWVHKGRRRLIQEECTLTEKWSWSEVKLVSPGVAAALPLGMPLPRAQGC